MEEETEEEKEKEEGWQEEKGGGGEGLSGRAYPSPPDADQVVGVAAGGGGVDGCWQTCRRSFSI